MFEQAQLGVVFDLLKRVARAVAATVGPHCEVVVHDLRDPEHTVIALSGDLTGRRVGSPVPDPEMLPENLDRFEDDYLLYSTRTPLGRQLLSSTVWVRDETGHIVGAICINMDFNDLRLARDLIDSVLNGTPSQPVEELETFATSPQDYVVIALRKALADIGKPVHALSRQDKIEVVHSLNQLGVFRFRHSVEVVMQELGISRASVYDYLKQIRTGLTAVPRFEDSVT